MAPDRPTQHRDDRHPFLLTVEDVAQQLGTNLKTGLTARQVAELQSKYLPNELEGSGGVSWYKTLLKQISNAMILVSQMLYFESQIMTDN
jgi:magnesium-transporting ATPase (P-type)